jgi:hypothetical protein
MNEFSQCFCKWVREKHVQDNAEHWLKTAIKNGKLKLIGE